MTKELRVPFERPPFRRMPNDHYNSDGRPKKGYRRKPLNLPRARTPTAAKSVVPGTQGGPMPNRRWANANPTVEGDNRKGPLREIAPGGLVDDCDVLVCGHKVFRPLSSRASRRHCRECLELGYGNLSSAEVEFLASIWWPWMTDEEFQKVLDKSKRL